MANEIYEVDDFEYSINTDENGNEYLIVKKYDGDAAKLTIPSTVTIDGKDYPVTEIGEWAFGDCFNLESITIPDSVTKIGKNAFYDCWSPTSITIPDSVTTIDWSAFEDCKKLKSVVIPDSVEFIGECAFNGCKNLTSVIIPDSVGDDIGWRAFKNCNNLTSIRLPKSWESKGEDALKAIGLDPSNPNLKITYGDQSQAQDQGQEKAPTVADLAKASAPTAKDIVNALGVSRPKTPAETPVKSRK